MVVDTAQQCSLSVRDLVPSRPLAEANEVRASRIARTCLHASTDFILTTGRSFVPVVVEIQKG